jgi:hypothetical protein
LNLSEGFALVRAVHVPNYRRIAGCKTGALPDKLFKKIELPGGRPLRRGMTQM